MVREIPICTNLVDVYPANGKSFGTDSEQYFNELSVQTVVLPFLNVHLFMLCNHKSGSAVIRSGIYTITTFFKVFEKYYHVAFSSIVRTADIWSSRFH